MSKYLSYDIHGLVKVRTNINCLPNYFLVPNSHLGRPDIEFYLCNSKIDTSQLTPLGARFFYNRDTFVYKLLFFLNMQLVVKETDEKKVIEFNRLYGLYRKPVRQFFAFLQMKLLDKGFSFIHSACIAKNGKGILFPAHSDTGKTTTTLHFIKSGYHTLGDDIVITDGEKILSYPSTIMKIWMPFKKIPILRRLEKKETVIGPLEKEVIPEKMFFLLNGEKDELRKANKKELCRKISLIMEQVAPLLPFPSDVMLGYYFVRNIRMEEYFKKREEILSKLVNKCETWLVLTKKSTMFYDLVKEIILN